MVLLVRQDLSLTLQLSNEQHPPIIFWPSYVNNREKIVQQPHVDKPRRPHVPILQQYLIL